MDLFFVIGRVFGESEWLKKNYLNNKVLLASFIEVTLLLNSVKLLKFYLFWEYSYALNLI